MSNEVKLLVEDGEGGLTEVRCARFAVIWQGKEVWVQPAGEQLMIGVDDEEDDQEYANLLVRPLASNLMSLALELEPIDDSGDVHECGPDCHHH